MVKKVKEKDMEFSYEIENPGQESTQLRVKIECNRNTGLVILLQRGNGAPRNLFEMSTEGYSVADEGGYMKRISGSKERLERLR